MQQPTNLTVDTAQAEHLLERWLGSPVQCTGIVRLTGGMLNSVLRLEFDRAPYRAVVKMNSEHDAGFEYEQQRLNYLRVRSAMRCPAVYDLGTPDDIVPYAYILMEHLPGITLNKAAPDDNGREAIDRQLAEITLELHSHTRATFGPVDDQSETQPTDDWTEIVVPRLVAMRDEMQNRLPATVLADIDAAVESAPAAFRDQGRPPMQGGEGAQDQAAGEGQRMPLLQVQVGADRRFQRPCRPRSRYL